MPLLRRTHDRHRDLRTLEAAARAASRNGGEPGERPMTRHGIIQRSTAGYRPPATDPRAPMVTVDADGAAFSHLQCRQQRAEEQRSRLSASILPLPYDGRAIADISRKSKSP
jgi:hypothetical protein